MVILGFGGEPKKQGGGKLQIFKRDQDPWLYQRLDGFMGIVGGSVCLKEPWRIYLG